MTNNPKPPKEDKLEAILEQVASKTIDSAIGIDNGELDLETGQRWILDAKSEALAQINNYIKEQMLSLIGEDEPEQQTTDNTVSLPNHRNWLRESMRKAIKERFK